MSTPWLDPQSQAAWQQLSAAARTLFHRIRSIPARLHIQEERMATAREQIDQLTARFNDFVSDVNAALQTLQAQRGQLDDEGQEALNRLNDAVQAADTAVGDADGSETPAEPAAPEPAAPEPGTEPGTGGDTGGDTPVDVPAEDTSGR